MAKKRISSVDLEWLILEELMQNRGSRAARPSLAVVPDDKRGWRALVAAGDVYDRGERARAYCCAGPTSVEV